MSETKKIKVVYEGEPIKSLDDNIIQALEGMGAEYYASGYNFKTNQRDVAFNTKLYDFFEAVGGYDRDGGSI